MKEMMMLRVLGYPFFKMGKVDEDDGDQNDSGDGVSDVHSGGGGSDEDGYLTIVMGQL